jgi:hypothetical protein
MARPVYSDFLQSHAFWLMDVSPIDSIALPIFNPLLGFSTISAPEITVEEFPIKPGNWMFDRQVIKRAAISGFSVQRGVTFADSDFWRWTMAALTGCVSFNTGGPSFRRTFILVHFFARNPVAGANTTSATSAVNFGPFEFAARIPARAYLLKGCIPTKWRAGNNFDAMDGSVSIAELDFSCEMVEEVSLASNASLGMVAGLAASAAMAVPAPPRSTTTAPAPAPEPAPAEPVIPTQ